MDDLFLAIFLSNQDTKKSKSKPIIKLEGSHRSQMSNQKEQTEASLFNKHEWIKANRSKNKALGKDILQYEHFRMSKSVFVFNYLCDSALCI